MGTDRERFEVENFYCIDVGGKRVVIYVHASSEPSFLFICPESVSKMLPWEIIMKKVHSKPETVQLHFEFNSELVLPQWYSEKRVCRVDDIQVFPFQGKFRKFSF